MTAIENSSVPLPLWRAIAGFGVLGTLLVVLLALAPVYVQNSRLAARVRAIVSKSPTVSEEVLRTTLQGEARELGIAILPGDMKISHPSGKLEVELKYIVEKNLGLYRVDLHFHPSAKTK